MRGLLIHPGELTKKWIDRMADNGVKVLGIHPEGGKKSIDSLNNLLRLLETEEYRGLIDYAIDERGLEIEYEFHGAGWLLSRELFDTHPEYFRMDENGERVQDMNFCFSNEEALDIVVERTAELAKKLYRSAPRYYFWLDDNTKMCQCEKCKGVSPSDVQLDIMNRVAERLRKDNPDATVAYLAYQDFITAPKNVKPADGIFLEFAPIKRDMAKPAAEGAELDNVRELLELFGNKDAKVLEYWYDNSLFSKWTKPPKQFAANNELIKGDLEFYKELGFDYIASFACFLGDDYEELWGDFDISAFGE